MPYTTGVTLPTSGELLVRLPLVNDSTYEGPETFQLTATNTSGTTYAGTATILDDGTGVVYPNNTTGNPDPNAVLNDDRPVKVNNREGILAQGLDPRLVGRNLVDIFTRMIYGQRFIHCDAHPGNLLVRKKQNALGHEIARAVHLVDPGLIVIGGGLGLNDRYREAIAAAIAQHVDAAYVPVPEIVPAGLGENAGIIGAALFVTTLLLVVRYIISHAAG